jgi:hypothetical protein
VAREFVTRAGGCCGTSLPRPTVRDAAHRRHGERLLVGSLLVRLSLRGRDVQEVVPLFDVRDQRRPVRPPSQPFLC